MITLTVPHINSNGNSKSQILTEVKTAISALTKVEDALSCMEYYDGRNGMDTNHSQRMREEHRANQVSIAVLRKQYIDLYQAIAGRKSKSK